MPLLEQLLPLFSSRLIRNRATLGGNLVTASPIGDAAPVLLALDARADAGERGRRARACRCASSSSATARRRCAPGEVIVERAPAARRCRRSQRFYKVSKRVLDDISTVAAAFALDLDAGRARRARCASPTAASPRRRCARRRSRTRCVGQPWTPETAAALLPSSPTASARR